ncbi:MAG: aldehyde dehydrogenase family protein, partial [Planctomycetota bacterium]
MLTEFRNEPTVDFTRDENVNAMKEALAKVSSELGREVDLVIGGERVRTTDKIKSLNPSNPNEVVGLVSKANQELAQRAMDVASSTFESWRRVSPHARARILWRAAS